MIRQRLTSYLPAFLLCAFAGAAHADNPWKWGPVKKDACTVTGMRQVSSRLWNIPGGTAWDYACQNAPRNVMGIEFARPDRCVDQGSGGEWGEWDVPDVSCNATPPAAPVRGGTGTLASPAPMEGYADLHVHQMAHLGFGGSIVWGAPYGNAASVLGAIPANMKQGHDRTEALFDGDYFGGIFSSTTHNEDGYSTFNTWPSRSLATHQQAYEDWLFRAYVGGLRLMVMLAVNSEDMFGRGENDVPIVGGATIQGVKAAGRSGNDMEALEHQIREAYRMQADVDARNGGAGQGWYRIVRDPDEASAVIASGKLAVILGTELQHLFNCDSDRPACTQATISEGLDRLEAMGVNYVFPIHHKLNQFGGSSNFVVLTNGPTEDCIETSQQCSSTGLTAIGKFLVEELTQRGMLIDTDHLGWKAFNDAMSIAEARGYPVVASHVGAFNLQAGDNQHEHMRKADQFRRIFNVGGMVALGSDWSSEEYSSSKTTPVKVPISCGGADRWANQYLFLKDLAGANALTGANGRLAFGSDWNGFASWPGPRYGASPCASRTAQNGQPIPKASPVAYPIALPSQLVPAAIGAATSLPMFSWFRMWDYNAEGFQHVGLTPDFVEDLRRTGLTLADIEALYRSARGTVELWKAARNKEVAGDRYRVRWAAKSPFDVLAFDYADASRNVEAAAGYPICRSRNGSRLGFESGGSCTLIEAAAVAPGPSEFVASNSGMCLSAEGNLLQRSCAGGQFDRQFDIVAAGGGWNDIKVVKTNKCLDVSGGSTAEGASVIEYACQGSTNQRWKVQAAGAYVELVNQKSSKCLRVSGDSSADGAQMVQWTCSALASQRYTQRAPTRLRTYEYPPAPISAYHAGRCLDVDGASTGDDAEVQQYACNGASNQRFQLRSSDNLNWEIVAVHSGRCVDVEGGTADGANVAQWGCHGGANQKFQLQRVGNTFRIKSAPSGKCLDVAGESRANGANVAQYTCHGASNQQWSIEPLRVNDYEKLYQADKNRIAWLAAATAGYPIAVTVDGTRAVCRSTDAARWVGLVSGSSCVGKTYSGSAATTSAFERLLQTR
ncbi:MAG TPA: RICIN domain-containing protein [Solimonas sp.]|nr:RICIN domain-containing protein [Solimonas sp.]